MRRIAALLVVTLATTGGGFVRPAAAQPGKEIAKRLFDEGVELEKKSDWQGAIAKYREAEAITVTAGLMFHEGFCLEQQNKLVDALNAYEKSIDLAHAQQKPEVEKATEVRAEPLRRKVPQISLKVTPAQAEVLLDGTALAAGLLDGRPFRVDPGEHTFIVRAAGFKEETRHVSAQLMATTPVEFVLQKATPGPDNGGPVTLPPNEPDKRDYTLPILTTAGAVVLLAGGVVSFVVAGSSASSAKDECAAAPTCDKQQGKIRTLDTLAIVGVVGGVGLGIVSGILWAKGPKVTVGPTSAWLEGKF